MSTALELEVEVALKYNDIIAHALLAPLLVIGSLCHLTYQALILVLVITLIPTVHLRK